MRRQPLVEERVVRRQQLRHAAVLAHLAARRTASSPAPSPRAGSRRTPGYSSRVGDEAGSLPNSSHRRGEASTSAFERGSRSMRRTCCSSTRRILQLAASRRVQQLVVRDAAPEEERQPRRQIEVARAIAEPAPVAARVRRGRGSSARPGCARARAGCRRRSPVFRAARPVEVEQRLDVGVGDRPAIGARRDASTESSARTRLSASPRLSGRADEHRAAAGDSPGPARRNGPPIDTVSTRRIAEVQLVRRAAEARLRRLQHAFGLPEPLDERHADLVRARLHRHAHFEPRVRGVHVALPLGIALACCRRSSPAWSSPCLRRRP